MSTPAFTLPDNVTVLERQATVAQIRNRATGEPLLNHNMHEVLLSTGQTVYGCGKCDFLALNRHSLPPHMNAHRRTRSAKLPSRPTLVQIRQATAETQELLRQVSILEGRLARLREERNEARTENRSLRQALRLLA